MRAIVLASTALALAIPVAAQTIAERLDKARTEVNTVENAAARAQTAIKAGNLPKATLEVNATKNAASRALYAIDKALEAVKPPHEHPPAGDVLSPTLDGAAPIKSEFDWRLGVNVLSEASQLTVKSAAPDVVGAFRFGCGAAGLGRFDPKVWPGDTTGKSHGHQFYGNLEITPFSTYETLRVKGRSTCGYDEQPLNRSAYWEPWMEDGEGSVVNQDHSTIYYKRAPANSLACTDPTNPHYKGICTPLPNGIFFIFGFDFITGTPKTGEPQWGCLDPTGKPFYAGDIPTAVASGLCVPGGRMVSRKVAPSCWDGKRLDSANHRDHVAYATFMSPLNGRLICNPTTHPYVIPQFTLITSRQIKLDDRPGNWRVSSDASRPHLPRGSTDHADFFMAWDPDIKFVWNEALDGCINGFLNCSSGTVSKTMQLVKAGQPYYPDATGRLMPNWYNPVHKVPVPGAEANTALIYKAY